ncbi:MAG: hypothetical protein COT37_02565 [Parcubacteria group bacterium CG08_land_8_20_14_0_20_43_9]|nr:MAG: hypothetical protein COT37_02565 [Parcubacteria group bacterium CG08_land_8_20_14_0_20_43_9]
MVCQKLADFCERFLEIERVFLISSEEKFSFIHLTDFLSPYSKILSITNRGRCSVSRMEKSTSQKYFFKYGGSIFLYFTAKSRIFQWPRKDKPLLELEIKTHL